MELTVTLLEPGKRAELFGPGDRTLRRIRDLAGVQVQARSATLRIIGEPDAVARAAAAVEQLQSMLRGRE